MKFNIMELVKMCQEISIDLNIVMCMGVLLTNNYGSKPDDWIY
jgi:hypothetical protein